MEDQIDIRILHGEKLVYLELKHDVGASPADVLHVLAEQARDATYIVSVSTFSDPYDEDKFVTLAVLSVT